jgi:hypothetical protein
MTEARDHYLGRIGETYLLADRPFSVTTHWASVNGKAVCVGIDVRSFTSKRGDGSDAKPVDGTWSEVTSPVVRALPVATAVEQGRRDMLGLSWYLEWSEDITAAQRQAAEAVTAAAAAKPQRGKPGPKPRVTDDILREVVAPAYRGGGRRAAQRVREALEQHRGELVTIDQASKAVAKARRRGFLPAYERGRK